MAVVLAVVVIGVGGGLQGESGMGNWEKERESKDRLHDF